MFQDPEMFQNGQNLPEMSQIYNLHFWSKQTYCTDRSHNTSDPLKSIRSMDRYQILSDQICLINWWHILSDRSPIPIFLRILQISLYFPLSMVISFRKVGGATLSTATNQRKGAGLTHTLWMEERNRKLGQTRRGRPTPEGIHIFMHPPRRGHNKFGDSRWAMKV